MYRRIAWTYFRTGCEGQKPWPGLKGQHVCHTHMRKFKGVSTAYAMQWTTLYFLLLSFSVKIRTVGSASLFCSIIGIRHWERLQRRLLKIPPELKNSCDSSLCSPSTFDLSFIIGCWDSFSSFAARIFAFWLFNLADIVSCFQFKNVVLKK